MEDFTFKPLHKKEQNLDIFYKNYKDIDQLNRVWFEEDVRLKVFSMLKESNLWILIWKRKDGVCYFNQHDLDKLNDN